MLPHYKLSLFVAATRIKLLSTLLLIGSCSVSPAQSLPEGSLEEQLAFVTQADNYTSESERLQDLFDLYLYRGNEIFVMLAGFYGYDEYNDRWPDLSPKGIAERITFYNRMYEAGLTIDRSKLKAADQVNYYVYLSFLEDQTQLYNNFPQPYLKWMSQAGGLHLSLPFYIQSMPRDTKQDYQNLLCRLDKLPEVLANLQTTLQAGIEEEITQPRTVMIQVPDQLQRLATDSLEMSEFFQPFLTIPDNIDKQKQLRQEAKKLIQNKVNPALLELKGFMHNQYLPESRETIALSDLPNGEAWYQQRIRDHTTTDMTAEEIHELGKQEVGRISQEMQAIQDEIGFEGDQAAFQEFLQSDSQFYYNSAEELLVAYRDICKRINPELTRLFGRLPQLPYGVRAVPKFREQASPPAYYLLGSFKANRPGYFYVNTSHPITRAKYMMQFLALHEAVPGHHFQISLAQELDNIAEFRDMISFNAFAEGWGMYTESLGDELGLYQDAYTRYGKLQADLMRTIRLVVDTGIHAFGWSRDDAIAYFIKHTGRS